MTVAVLIAFVAVVELGGIIALGVLLIVSRRQLKGARVALERSRTRQGIRRRRRRGVAPLAVRTAFKTADSVITKGLGATVRNSVEDLAGWAQVERPDLARLTADGDVVIAFSDIEDSTARNEALGDREWVKVLERHNRLIQNRVDDHGGHVVKNQGDGFMLAFPDAGRAVLCAIDVQRALFDDAERWEGIRIRMGIHVGTSVRRGDDLFGRNVAMAARVAGEAGGGEILVSESVRDAIGGLPDIELCASREVELKGFQGWHNLFRIKVPD
jgi:adenylate cyclase